MSSLSLKLARKGTVNTGTRRAHGIAVAATKTREGTVTSWIHRLESAVELLVQMTSCFIIGVAW